MKRLLTTAAAGLALVAGTGSVAQAQTTAPLFELGLYGGGQWTSNWFEIADEGYGVGFGPIFGAEATFWASPSFGIRVHGGYFPSGLPEADDQSVSEADYPLNNYLADLNLVFRPFGERMGFLNSPYLFLGGGALVTDAATDPAGDRDVYTCVAFYTRDGVCLSHQPGYATVGQGVVGLGWDWVPLTSNIGIFSELAVHGYDSPAHVFNDTRAEDKFAFTPRASLGLKFAFGGEPEVVPVPPMAPPPPPPPPPPAAPATRDITVCVVENGMLREVTAVYNPATGDTTVTGRRFSQAYPATTPNYASNAPWFVQSDSVSFNNRQYVKFGVTRVITPTSQLVRAGEVNGVPVFAESGATTPQRVLYVPVRPGCEFQPYEQRAAIRPRG